MHSKWKIWDFLKSRPNGLSGETRLIAFSCYDPLAFKLIKDHFNYTVFENETLGVVLGKEITSEWFDDNFKSLGLFGNSDSFLIHFADELSEEIKENLLEFDNLIMDNRVLILNFAKDDKFFKKLQKHKSPLIETISIQAPAFWEELELIEYLCKTLQVNLTYPAKEKIKERVPFNLNSYYQLLTQIKINFNDQVEIDVKDILPLFSEIKVDQFELADLFGSKKLKAFYYKIIESMGEGHDIIGNISFLQSHLIKMYDLSYMDAKPKLTKYDKKIMNHSGLWTKDELKRAMNYLSEILIMAKRKDAFLEQKFKSGFLKTLNF